MEYSQFNKFISTININQEDIDNCDNINNFDNTPQNSNKTILSITNSEQIELNSNIINNLPTNYTCIIFNCKVQVHSTSTNNNINTLIFMDNTICEYGSFISNINNIYFHKQVDLSGTNVFLQCHNSSNGNTIQVEPRNLIFNLPVTNCSYRNFLGCYLNKLIIDYNVTFVGRGCFDEASINNIVFPNHIEHYEKQAFDLWVGETDYYFISQQVQEIVFNRLSNIFYDNENIDNILQQTIINANNKIIKYIDENKNNLDPIFNFIVEQENKLSILEECRINDYFTYYQIACIVVNHYH